MTAVGPRRSARPTRVPEGFPWRVLARPIAARDAASVRRYLAALVRWQRSLRAWPGVPRGAPDATPFVSLYVGGRVRGCFGFDDGAPGERIARAFVRALGDARFAPIVAAERDDVVAQVSYACGPFAVYRDPDEALARIEVGTDGVLLVHPRCAPAVLLPQVARDGRLDPRGLLTALARKAGLEPDGWRDGDVITFGAACVDSRAVDPRAGQPLDLAAAWLARQVARDGAVRFAIDARTGRETARGAMYHGRAATLVAALAAHGGEPRALARARAFLARELAAASAGQRVEAWPDAPAMVGGTLALCALAGVPGARASAASFARESTAAVASPWHAAQLVAALGPDAPAPVYAACVADLAHRPFAPWALMAARARADAPTIARCEAALCEALAERGPHRGGANVTPVAETALTAAAVEALAPLGSKRARGAVARGRAFVLRWQLVPGSGDTAAIDPAHALGAFPASPVNDTLRCDITAHAVLALLNPTA